MTDLAVYARPIFRTGSTVCKCQTSIVVLTFFAVLSHSRGITAFTQPVPVVIPHILFQLPR